MMVNNSLSSFAIAETPGPMFSLSQPDSCFAVALFYGYLGSSSFFVAWRLRASILFSGHRPSVPAIKAGRTISGCINQ
jgi:hypothetical protein